MFRLFLLSSFFLWLGKCDLIYYMDQMCDKTIDMKTPTNDDWRVALDLTQPGSYDYMYCWMVIVTKPTRKLRFRFTYFSSRISSLQLSILDGNKNSGYVPAIGGLLTHESRPVIGKLYTSYDNILSLYCIADHYLRVDKGFEMLIESIDAGPNGTGVLDLHCGESFDLAALNMQSYFLKASSFSKSTYQADVNCTVVFKTKLSDELTVQIKKSSIEECTKCSCDSLELRDGSTASSPYVAGIDKKLCGYWNETSTVFKTVGNSLFVKFVSDHGIHLTGFELLITTKRNDGMLKRSITVGCDATNWNVSINMAQLRTLYPGVKTSDIYFGENRCSGTETLSDLTFHYGLDECLTNEKDLNTIVKYTNEVICVERNPQFTFLIKSYVWRIAVECDITTDNSSVGGFKDEIILGQTAYGQQEKMNMSFYLTPNFATEVPGDPLKASAGAHIYIKVFTEEITDWTVKMRLKTCYIEPTLDAPDNMKYYIVKNGCEVDANTHILSQLAHETRLVFDYFEYAGNRNGIYVICEGIICTPSDTSLPCTQDCNPVTAKRSLFIDRK